MLNEGDGRRHHRGGSTDCGDDEGKVGQLPVHGLCAEEREHASHEVETRIDHGRCVDECRNGRWTFHRIGQPHVKRELCGFTNRSDKHQTECPCEGPGVGSGDLIDVVFVEDHGIVEGTKEIPENSQTNHEEDVTNPRGRTPFFAA